jgi:hypothetical protein
LAAAAPALPTRHGGRTRTRLPPCQACQPRPLSGVRHARQPCRRTLAPARQLPQPVEGRGNRYGHEQEDGRGPQGAPPGGLALAIGAWPVVTARHGVPFSASFARAAEQPGRVRRGLDVASSKRANAVAALMQAALTLNRIGLAGQCLFCLPRRDRSAAGPAAMPQGCWGASRCPHLRQRSSRPIAQLRVSPASAGKPAGARRAPIVA